MNPNDFDKQAVYDAINAADQMCSYLLNGVPLEDKIAKPKAWQSLYDAAFAARKSLEDAKASMDRFIYGGR